MTKPILKWVGGKTQIIENVFKNFPKEIGVYHEPFLGGGSVLFHLLNQINEGKIVVNNIYASDSNEALIGVYKNIQNRHTELYNELSIIIKEFNAIYGNIICRNPHLQTEAKTSKESYYYYIRNQFNALVDRESILCSAMFIFLNKTCFRGLYRVGPNGFNVPYGHYNNPEIINEKHLEEIHELIQGVTFETLDFTEALEKAKAGDFVYLDPPYAPVAKDSFVGYTSLPFKHQLLFDSLKQAKYRYLLSNADVPFVRENTSNCTSETIPAKRSINSKRPDSIVNELLIKNFT
uniref:site-specific DNA-methyltransferase (adenine-specific) n=1 Tax=viral metagenome TaxID=1070528 RepID=A0A6C0B0I6_9ZZZZ